MFDIGLLMVLALILQFSKLNSHLIICNTLLFHRINISILSHSRGAKDNGAYLKRINFCGAKTIAKFVDFHILCESFSHVQFSQFCPNISLYSLQTFSLFPIAASLINDSRKFMQTKYKNFAKGISIACFYYKFFSLLGNRYQDSLEFGTSLFEKILLQSVSATMLFK